MESRNNMHMLKDKKGSLTVEAAVTLPIFICAIISVAFLIKVIYVHEVVHYALTQTADQMAQYSYIIYASGIYDINGNINENLDKRIKEYDSHMSFYKSTYKKIKENADNINRNLQNTQNNKILYEIGNILNDMKAIPYDMKNEEASLPETLKNTGAIVVKSAYNDAVSKCFIPVAKSMTIKNINCITGKEAKKIIKNLDFTSSKFYGHDENIDIVVKYKVDLPLPFDFLPDICLVERAVVRTWLDGGEIGTYISAKDSSSDKDEFNVWDIEPNYRRGKIIAQMNGRDKDIPDRFPVVDKFNKYTGKVTSFISMRLTSPTYKKGSSIRYKLKNDINKLINFNGAKVKNYEIKNDDIKSKQLILFVPKGSINNVATLELNKCIRYAKTYGIELIIKEL